MFKHAFDSGELHNKILIDATSGNTGLAYAMLGAYYQIPIELVLPENASVSRYTAYSVLVELFTVGSLIISGSK